MNDSECSAGRVSVVVPVYNVDRFLPECVDSVLRQSYRKLELILVDDGSTDRSGELCDRFAQQDPRVRVIHQPNRGSAAARNRGLDAARGEYVYFLDSDDFIADDTIRRVVERAEADHLDLILFDGQIISEDGQCLGDPRCLVTFTRSDPGVCSGKQLFVEMVFNENFRVYVQCYLIRRSLFLRSGLRFDPGGFPHEDLLFTFFLLMHCERCGHLPEPFFRYRRRSGSVMNSGLKERNVGGHLYSLEKISEYYRNNCFEPVVDAAVRLRLIHVFWAAYSRFRLYYGPKYRKENTRGANRGKDAALRERLFGCMKALNYLGDPDIRKRCRFSWLYELIAWIAEGRRRVVRHLPSAGKALQFSKIPL
jgi:glycosyltransferase involved in cell wall biosynthesis